MSSLFDQPPVPIAAPEPPDQAIQPTLSKEERERQKLERIAKEKAELEASIARGETDSVRNRVAYLLNQNSELRNSDIELVINFWRTFHSDEVGREHIAYESLRNITAYGTIVRARATIQNTYKLFVSDDAVASHREELENSVRKKQRAASSAVIPFITVYSDESGKTERNYVIGSLWINDADNHSYKLLLKLNEWRKTLEQERELKFTNITRQRVGTYLNLFETVMGLSEYIGFKAVVLARDDVRSRPVEDAIFRLYYELVVKGLQHEADSGRMILPRNVNIFKDQDEGADKLHLSQLGERLRVDCPKVFDNQAQIRQVNTLDSSSHILMQVADIFTGSVNRIVNRQVDGERNHKDEVADGIMRMLKVDPANLTGDITQDFVRIIQM
jgi:hypothetical protein